MTESQTKKAQIACAENQFIGFFHAKKGYDIKTLCESMGLTETEWKKIKHTMSSYFSQTDVEEIDSLFI